MGHRFSQHGRKLKHKKKGFDDIIDGIQADSGIQYRHLQIGINNLAQMKIQSIPNDLKLITL